jgi:hypothetical protein
MAMKGVHKPQSNLTRNASQPHPGGDYDKSAHTDGHHGKHGSATGHRRDNAPMDYVRKTRAEGAKSQPVAGHPGNTNVGMGAPHCVGSTSHPARGADGFGCHAHGRGGVLRYSGHPNAHRVGKK